MKGKFIVFEGIDGSGKSTQAKMLHESLVANNIDCILTFEPTNKNYGKKIRDSFTTERLPIETELEYFTLDRQEHLNELVLPSLEKGTIVISDRYYYSTAAYQGARELDYKAIIENQMAQFLKPDICFLLNIDIESTSKRIELRGSANSFENIEYLKNVADIFRKIENDKALNESIVNINADRSPEAVHGEVLSITNKLLLG